MSNRSGLVYESVCVCVCVCVWVGGVSNTSGKYVHSVYVPGVVGVNLFSAEKVRSQCHVCELVYVYVSITLNYCSYLYMLTHVQAPIDAGRV